MELGINAKVPKVLIYISSQFQTITVYQSVEYFLYLWLINSIEIICQNILYKVWDLIGLIENKSTDSITVDDTTKRLLYVIVHLPPFDLNASLFINP